MSDFTSNDLSMDQIFNMGTEVISNINQLANNISGLIDPDSRRTPQGAPGLSLSNMPMMNMGGGYPHTQMAKPVQYGYGYADGSNPYGNVYSNNNNGIIGITDPGYGFENGGYNPGAFSQFNFGGGFR